MHGDQERPHDKNSEDKPQSRFLLIIFIYTQAINMQENLQTAQDIFNRNTHTNPFQIKLPSHHASQQNINIMAQAFILNKLALLPFYQH